MPQFQPVEYEEATPEVRVIYDEVRRALGTERLPNWVKAMGVNARLLRGNWEKTRASLVEGLVPHLLKELILFTISTRRGVDYCSACHAHAALSLDPSLTLADLEALTRSGAYEAMPPAFRTAIDIVTRSALEPYSIGEEELGALERAGFSAQEIPELLAQADLAMMFNTITSTYRLPLDPEYVGARVSQLSE
jgi:alkylhydroperoxidase family enzyme